MQLEMFKESREMFCLKCFKDTKHQMYKQSVKRKFESCVCTECYSWICGEQSLNAQEKARNKPNWLRDQLRKKLHLHFQKTYGWDYLEIKKEVEEYDLHTLTQWYFKEEE